MSIDGRLTMCNMAIEAGGKCGIVGYDQTTADYLAAAPGGQPRAPLPTGCFASDADAGTRR